MKNSFSRTVLIGFVFALLLCGTMAPAQVQKASYYREDMKIILNNVSDDIQKHFYDPELHGLNWKQLTADARAKIEQANSASEMVTAIFILVNKLGDSHTKFLPPGRLNRLQFGFEARAVGEDIFIHKVKPDSAAQKAGLLPGDRIIAINGFNAQRATFDLMMLDFRALRPQPAWRIAYQRGDGPEQMVDVIAVVKEGHTVIKDFDIWDLIREIEADGKENRYLYGVNNEGIGYLKLPTFSYDPEDIDTAARKLDKAAATIIDLRGNGGGRLDSLVDFAGHFESSPAVMANIVRRNKSEPVKVRPLNPRIEGPMVILVDSHTASASEMFARHFQLTGRAVVVGDTSSGRVTASLFYDHLVGMGRSMLYGVQIGVGRVVFPEGEELEKRGVKPDRMCLPTGNDLREKRDPCLGLAYDIAKKGLLSKSAAAGGK
ncbi:MAG: S41 family peptidase [Terriglobales bacterium]